MSIKTIGVTAAAVVATAIAGGAATGRDVNSQWYLRLRKPSYQPPRQAFPIVWPLLYGDIALVSADTIDRLSKDGHDERLSRVSWKLRWRSPA
jgi:tryptophan-rich sensory protein